MRMPQTEKMEVIRLVEASNLPVRKTLAELGIARTTFYRWYRAYAKSGYEGLAPPKAKGQSTHFWNQVPTAIRDQIVTLALDKPELSSRELAQLFTDHQGYYVSESSVYRILKAKGLLTAPAFLVMQAADEFKDKTSRIHQLWQTDFTYFRVKGWGWYYLSSILDDYSRYIIAWQLCASMKTTDVQQTLDLALAHTNIPRTQRPKLLSDNGSCYISKELRQYLKAEQIQHVRSAPHHPMTQGKIERYHRSMKSLLLLDFDLSPDGLRNRIQDWVQHYNHHRYHEALDNLTPADVYFGRKEQILKRRLQIKLDTLKLRRKQYILSTYLQPTNRP